MSPVLTAARVIEGAGVPTFEYGIESASSAGAPPAKVAKARTTDKRRIGLLWDGRTFTKTYANAIPICILRAKVERKLLSMFSGTYLGTCSHTCKEMHIHR